MEIKINKITGNESAMPLIVVTETHSVTGAPSKQDISTGLTIRQQFAYGNMVALASTLKGDYMITEKLASDIAKESLMLADALIKELNKSQDRKDAMNYGEQ